MADTYAHKTMNSKVKDAVPPKVMITPPDVILVPQVEWPMISVSVPPRIWV
jgi:hypothetical protein